MKIFISILLIILSPLFCKKSDFEIVEATKQSWAGGFRGSGYGTNYVIKTVAKQSSKKLRIDQLWIGDDKFDISVIKGYNLPYGNQDTNFIKNDTVFIVASFKQKVDRDGNPIFDDSNLTKIKPPIKYEGDALIGYLINNKRFYKVISKFTRLEDLNYQ